MDTAVDMSGRVLVEKYMKEPRIYLYCTDLFLVNKCHTTELAHDTLGVPKVEDFSFAYKHLFDLDAVYW